MKLDKLVTLVGVHRWDLRYSKDLPYYRLLQICRAGFLISGLGMIAWIIFRENEKVSFILFALSLMLLGIVLSIYYIVSLRRKEKHDFPKDKDLFSLVSKEKK